MRKFYKIADLVVAMDTIGRTFDQAEPYVCEEQEKIDIEIQSGLHEFSNRYPQADDSLCEYMDTAKYFYRQLIDFDGFMLHSSAVVVDGRAYLFSADSGTGKSTHTQLWLDQFPGSFILNDDKPALRLVDGKWYAYGTPWSGKHDISVNVGVPLAGIAFLERCEGNVICSFSGADAIFALFKQVNKKTGTAEFRKKLLDLLDKLITQVPIWKLKCNMDPEAAIVSYEAMSGKKYEKSL